MTTTINEHDKFNEICIEEKKLTSESAPNFKSQLILLAAQDKSILCNLKNIDYIDSSGLSCFLIGDRLTKESNCKFVICNASDSVLNLIKLTKLDAVLTVISTLEEAKDFILLDDLEKNL